MDRQWAALRVERAADDLHAWLRVFVPAGFALRVPLRAGVTAAARSGAECNIAVRLRRSGGRVAVAWSAIGGASAGTFDGRLLVEPAGEAAILTLAGAWRGDEPPQVAATIGQDLLRYLRDRAAGLSAARPAV